MFFLMSMSGKECEIVDEDTLKLHKMPINNFLYLVFSGEVGGNFSRDLVIGNGYTLDDLSELYQYRYVSSGVFPEYVDIKVTDEDMYFMLSTNSKSWRRNKMLYANNDVYAFGDGRFTYIWREGLLYTISDIRFIHGLYYKEDRLMLSYADDSYMRTEVSISPEKFCLPSIKYEPCELREVKRKILLS